MLYARFAYSGISQKLLAATEQCEAITKKWLKDSGCEHACSLNEVTNEGTTTVVGVTCSMPEPSGHVSSVPSTDGFTAPALREEKQLP